MGEKNYGNYASGSIFVCTERTVFPGGRETKQDETLRHPCTSDSLPAFRLKIPPAKDKQTLGTSPLFYSTRLFYIALKRKHDFRLYLRLVIATPYRLIEQRSVEVGMRQM
jgi:hypothetical protein